MAGCVAAEEEAAEILAAAGDVDATTLESCIRRRERGEPLAWITGTTRFCGRTIQVDPGVYVPRAQSQELARRAAGVLAAAGVGARAVDLCAGSGAIAAYLCAAAPEATVLAVDVDRRAAACARRNGVLAMVGDLGQSLTRRSFDLVTAVAPYVPTDELRLLPADVIVYEPNRALAGGVDGLELVRQVVEAAADLLRPGGLLLAEIGGAQDRLLATTLDGHGFGEVATWRDEEGDLRGLAAQLA